MRPSAEGAAEPRVGEPAFLRTVIDSVDVSVIVTRPDGTIVLWNEGAAQLYGWSADEVVGASIVERLAPVDDLARNAADLSTVASGRAMSGDRLVRRRDGEVIRIHTSTRPITDDDGVVVALVGVSEDVTAQRAAEQHARDLTEHFRAALQAGGLGTWRWDIRTGATVWDARLEELFGVAPGGFDGTFDSYVSLLHPDDRDHVLRTVEESVASKSSYVVEHRVVLDDGSLRWIEGVGGVTVDEFGTVTGAVGCSMDVTERKERELERQRLSIAAIEIAERERMQRERLEFLSVVNDAVNASSTVEELMRRVTRAMVPRLGDWCSIHVLPDHGEPLPDVEVAHVDPEMVRYAIELRERLPYDPDAASGVAAVIRTGRTDFVPEISDELLVSLDLTDEVREIVARLDLRSSISVALKKRGSVLGAIQFVRSGESRPYSDDDVALAETIAGRLASSIENLRLYEREREVAHTLQQSLLPATLPDVPGVDIAVRYWPTGGAREVGGDFYDVFALDGDDQWAIVIGDVCGTGPAAAANTALARHTIRDSAWHGDEPADVLRSLNVALRRSGNGTFVTLVYASLDLSHRGPVLTTVVGGHPLPVRVGPNGAETIGRSGTLLGVIDEVRAEATETHLESGDVVVFYTDGATDVPPPHFLEASELVDLVADSVHPGQGAEAIADRIHLALDSALSFQRRTDDIALVIVRVR